MSASWENEDLVIYDDQTGSLAAAVDVVQCVELLRVPHNSPEAGSQVGAPCQNPYELEGP